MKILKNTKFQQITIINKKHENIFFFSKNLKKRELQKIQNFRKSQISIFTIITKISKYQRFHKISKITKKK